MSALADKQVIVPTWRVIGVFSYVNEEDKNEMSMYVETSLIDSMRDFFAELDAGFWILAEYCFFFVCVLFTMEWLPAQHTFKCNLHF